jgi:hypothetical protein
MHVSSVISAEMGASLLQEFKKIKDAGIADIQTRTESDDFHRILHNHLSTIQLLDINLTADSLYDKLRLGSMYGEDRMDIRTSTMRAPSNRESEFIDQLCR